MYNRADYIFLFIQKASLRPAKAVLVYSIIIEDPQLQENLKHAKHRILMVVFTSLVSYRPIHHLFSLLILLPLFRSELHQARLLLLTRYFDPIYRPPQTQRLEEKGEPFNGSLLCYSLCKRISNKVVEHIHIIEGFHLYKGQ
jgi:hypothetical protein